MSKDKERYCNSCEDYTLQEFLPDVIGDRELPFGSWRCNICKNEVEDTGEKDYDEE